MKYKYKLYYIKNVLSLFRSSLYRSGSLIFSLFSIILWIIYIVSSPDSLSSGGGLSSIFILVSCATGSGGAVNGSTAPATVRDDTYITIALP